MNEMTLLVNAARTDPILRDAALAVEKRLLEAQRSYETAERAAVMWMERAEAAEAEVARLRDGLRDGIRIASQYLDTGRGDLDGWIDSARALLAEDGAA